MDGTISEEEYSLQADEIWERLKLVTTNSEGDINGNDADEE